MQNEQAIQNFMALRPLDYCRLIRFDQRLYYSVSLGGNAIRLDIWLSPKGNNKIIASQQLHFIGYEVIFTASPNDLFGIVGNSFYLSLRSISDRHLERLHYEIMERERGSLFYCHAFEAHIEEVDFEFIL